MMPTTQTQQILAALVAASLITSASLGRAQDITPEVVSLKPVVSTMTIEDRAQLDFALQMKKSKRRKIAGISLIAAGAAGLVLAPVIASVGTRCAYPGESCQDAKMGNTYISVVAGASFALLSASVGTGLLIRAGKLRRRAQRDALQVGIGAGSLTLSGRF